MTHPGHSAPAQHLQGHSQQQHQHQLCMHTVCYVAVTDQHGKKLQHQTLCMKPVAYMCNLSMLHVYGSTHCVKAETREQCSLQMHKSTLAVDSADTPGETCQHSKGPPPNLTCPITRGLNTRMTQSCCSAFVILQQSNRGKELGQLNYAFERLSTVCYGNPTSLAALIDKGKRRLKMADDIMGFCVTARQLLVVQLWVTRRQFDTSLEDSSDACCLQCCQVRLGIS